MGRASKWFRSLLTSKKSPESSSATEEKNRKKKKSKWAFSKNSNGEDPLVSSPYDEGLDANKHAIAVAAATAAVAEAALAAAHAAAQVVRLTSGGGGSGRGGGDRRPAVLAAVKIQSAFRAYLARRALRALKGLVKLQALVRGRIVRKQSADMLRRMQAMARIQARASAHRSYTSESSIAKTKFSSSKHLGNANQRQYEERSNSAKHGGALLKQNHSRSSTNRESPHVDSRWLNHWMEQHTWNNLHDNSHVDDDNRTDKILEIDTWKPHSNPTPRRNDRNAPTSQYFSEWSDNSRHSSKLQKPNPSISSEDVASVISQKFPPEGDLFAAWTSENSPRVHSASSRPSRNQRGPFTPECSRSLFGDFLGHPNYMANTESSRAKVRSHSAPKQRIELEGLALSSNSGRDLSEFDTISERGSVALPSKHRGNTCHYGGYAKRQGTPVRDPYVGYSYNPLYGRKI